MNKNFKDWEVRLADAFELMRQDKKDIYWLSVHWDRYDAWSKLGFLKATVSYALKRDELMIHNRRYGTENSRPYILPPGRAVNVDTEIDFKVAETLIKERSII